MISQTAGELTPTVSFGPTFLCEFTPERMLGLTCVIFKDLAMSLTALVPPAGSWEPAAPVVSYTRSGTAESRLPGRRAAVRSVGGAAGARRPPDSPPSSNALYPDQRCLSGSAAPGP